MNFKFKVNENTTLEEARKFLDTIQSANVKEIFLNDIRKLHKYLGVEELPLKGGSVIRFRHELLVGNKNHLDGIFTIHIIHKGGDQQLLRMVDFKSYLYDPLKQIIELKSTKK